MGEILVGIGTIVAGIGSLAAWRNAKAANHQTNGQLHEPLARIEAKLDDLTEWQAQHVSRWHLN